MSFYEEFLALGYSKCEARELSCLAENFGDDHITDIQPDEAMQTLIDKLNEIGCTSFRMKADELEKMMKRLI